MLMITPLSSRSVAHHNNDNTQTDSEGRVVYGVWTQAASDIRVRRRAGGVGKTEEDMMSVRAPGTPENLGFD